MEGWLCGRWLRGAEASDGLCAGTVMATVDFDRLHPIPKNMSIVQIPCAMPSHFIMQVP